MFLWIYGAGYVGRRDLSVSGMMRATGIALACDAVPWEHRIGITNFEHPITRNLSGDLTFGTSRHYGPIFKVADQEAVELGRSFGNHMCQDVALAVKEFGRGARGHAAGMRGAGDYASIYCEAPDLPAALLREIARYAGCHVYLETNDFLIAGKDIVMVHSAKPGQRMLRLPHAARIEEATTGATLARRTDEIPFDIPKGGGTVLFRQTLPPCSPVKLPPRPAR